MENNLKENLVNHLKGLIDNKIEVLEDVIKEAKISRDSETKSSAGDKYETSRAMIHIEIQKNEAQLRINSQLKHEVEKIDANKITKKIELGSIVKTSQGIFFMSVGLGKIALNKSNYYAISLASPLGKLIRHRCEGDVVDFKNMKLVIEEQY